MRKFKEHKYSQWFRLLCCIVLLTFGVNVIGEDAARAWSIAEPQGELMPPPGTLLPTSLAFSLPTLKGISIDPTDPFKIDFIVDSADQNLNEKIGQEQVNLLVKYFLSFLTLPEEDLWVNLSPYEKNRIITSEFETTNAGRDMLVQDYILKQLASSLTYPDHEIGKLFWQKVYNRARAEYGSTDIPINTFNRVWVVPDRAVVYEENGSAFISESRLKVLTEEDYLSIEKHSDRAQRSFIKRQGIDRLSTEVTREIIIPELEREVNEGKYFSPLRQMYNSLILAIWFKKRYKEHLIYQAYVDQRKISGITLNDKQIKEKIYAQYLRAYKKGVYNYIKEESDPMTGQTVPRKYFSGGFSFVDAAMKVSFRPASSMREHISAVFLEGLYRVTVALEPLGIPKAKLMSLVVAGAFMMGGTHQAYGEVVNNSIPSAVLHVEKHPRSLLQSNKDIAALKEDIAVKWSILQQQQMKGGERQVRSASLGYEEKELAQLEKAVRSGVVNTQWNFTHPFRGIGNLVATPLKLAAPRSWRGTIDNITHPVQYGAHIIDKISADRPQANAVVAPAVPEPSIPGPVIVGPVQTIPAPSVPAPTIPTPSPTTPAPTTVTPSPTTPAPGVSAPSSVSSSTAPHVQTVQSNIPGTGQELGAGPYHIATTVTTIPVQDHVVALYSGIVTGFDAGKREYKAGETMLSLLDPQLNSRSNQLTTEIEIRKQQLSDLKVLFARQAATSQELIIAQERLGELFEELAKVNEQKAASRVVAPHDLTVQNILVADGMQASKGENLLEYVDNQRVRINFQVPTAVNYFNRIGELSINGVPVKSIVSVDWSPDPLQKNAQVSMVVISASPIQGGQEVSVETTISSPLTYFQDLNSITGQTQTIAPVLKVEQYDLRSPADGPVRFLVHEGQEVKEGQVIAVVELKHYDEEYRNIRLGIRGIDIELSQAVDPDGTLLISRDKLDSLKTQRAGLISELKKVQIIIESLHIRSPGNGVVNSLADAYQSGVFQRGDSICRIGTGKVMVGSSLDGSPNPILVPRSLAININSPVVVETPSGVRLPGQVMNVNKDLRNSTMDLSEYQAIEVMALDQQGILQTNLPVKVILPQEGKEMKIISDALAKIEEAKSVSASPGPPPPPSWEQVEGFALSSSQANAVLFPANSQVDAQFSMDLSGVAGLVGKNELVMGNDVIKALQAKAAEAYPKASSLSLTGGVYMTPDGRVAFSGGIMGAFNNSLQGGISSGNAIGAAVPLVVELVGNVTKVISGEVKKETARAVEQTKVVYHHMEAGINHHVNEAQDLLIDIGAAQQKIEEAKQLQSDLEKAREVMLAREAGGFSLKTERDQVEINIQDLKAHLLELEAKQKDWIASLNFYTSPSNIYSNKPVFAVLPWGKDFSTIDEATENTMQQNLVGPGSLNPRMQEVMAADKVAEMTLKLQKLKRLPVLNMGSVVIDNGTGLNPFYDVSEPVTGERSSLLQGGGANSVAQGQINLLDTGLKTKEIIVTLAGKESKLNIAKTKAELTQKLTQATGDIRSLSAQIQQAQEAYRNAISVWQLKAKRPDVYLSYQMVQDRIEINKRWQELIDLKAQYFKAESVLREIGVLGQETSMAQDVMNGFQTAVSNAVAGSFTNNWFTIPGLPSPPDMTTGVSNQTAAEGNSLFAAGTVNYQVGDAPSAWALMHNGPSGSNTGPLRTVKQILIEDPNVFVRADALRHFLTEYQNNGQFLPVLQEIVLNSPHADVVWELLKYMSQREDRDMRFFVQIIHQAEVNNNDLLARLGFQSMGDIFTMHPEDLGKLTQAAFINSPDAPYPQVSPEIANKVFLTFLAQEPDTSIARERFLQSDFWNADDLARIYKQLASYVESHKDEEGFSRIESLSKFISDSILRKQAVANINEVFRAGSFDTLGNLKYLIKADVVTHVQITENAKETLRFLNISPAWTNMEEVIHPKLWARAQQETQELLSTPLQGAGEPVYHISDSDIPHHELAYFESLGLNGQQDYIQKSQDVSELARILALQTPLRTAALDRLMQTDQGRVMVLKTYLESSDPEFLQSIESRPWMEALRMDVLKVSNAADNLIFRTALKKMYDRTGQEVYLNLRLRTYSDLELRSLNDPRGDSLKEAAIKRVATERAIKVYEERINIQPPWAGYSFENTRIKDELANIAHMIDQDLDPRAIDRYINQRINADGDIGEMLKDLKKIRDQIAEKISTNDQNIPKFPILEIAVFIAAGLSFLGVFIKKIHAQFFRVYADSPKRITSIRNKLIGPRDSAQLGKMASDLPTQVFGPTTPALKNWYALVSEWDGGGDVPAERIITELNTILNSAEEALRLMPYDADLMYSGQGQDALKTDIYQKTYSYYIVLALDTLNMMNERLKGHDLNEIQRLELQARTKILVDYINYATRFRRILYDRGSMERVIGYKFSNKHWTEWSGLAPLARFFTGDTPLWRISERRLKKEVPLLLDEGNSLMPGFYQDKQGIIDETNQLLKKATDRGGSLNNTLSRDARHKARMGSFIGRLKYLIGFSWMIFAAATLLWGSTMISAEFSLIVFVVLITTTYFAYWGPYLDILAMDWNKDIRVELAKQNVKSEKILNLPEKTSSDKTADENIVALSQLEDAQQTKVELDTRHPPGVDMIVIVPQNEGNRDGLNQYVKSRFGKLIRNDVPVEVTTSQYRGSGNAYLDVLLQSKRKFESPEYRQRYPHLKSWKESRVMFVFHGNDASQNQDVQYSLLDLAISNGYRLAKKDSTDTGKEGGNIVVYSRDAYYGPVPYFPTSGITLLTSKVNRDELKGYGFVNTGGGFASNTQDTVFQVYEKLDLDALEDDLEPLKAGAWRNLEDRFMLSNHILKQFPVLNGRISIASDAVEVLTKIAEHIEANRSWEQWPRHLSGDLLIPMIMISKLDKRDLEKEIDDYIDQRSEWGDLRENGRKLENGRLQMVQGHLEQFYDVIEKYDSHTPINAFLPHSKMSLLMHIAGDNSAEAANRFRGAIKASPVNNAQISSVPGGIDFTTINDKVLFQRNKNILSARSMIKSFKGFGFQVIQYHPILNPAELFLGSSVEKSGTWFSSRALPANRDQA